MIHQDHFLRLGAVVRTILISFFAIAGIAIVSANSASAAIDVTVVDENGVPVNGFKWTLEQDPMFQVEPGVQTADILAYDFHKSHAPVAQTGETAAGESTVSIAVPAGSGPYFVSIIPYADPAGDRIFTIGGGKASDGDAITVVTHTGPLPAAQLSVMVFEDNAPINGAPDFGGGLPGAGVERPLGPDDGPFAVLVIDAGGQYGAAGGQVTLDIFGNPLGTKYNNSDPDDIFSMGDGTFVPDDNGLIFIENLPPGKFEVQVVPPAGSGWRQTSTIEGGKGSDAWVKANEPIYMQEFGPPRWHTFFGFVRDIYAAGPGSTVSGRITNNHMSRPPAVAFYSGNPFPACYVGLNSGAQGVGAAIAAQPCNDDSTFAIPNVPDGQYGLVIWDQFLNIIIADSPVTVAGGDTDLGDIPVFNWYGRLDSSAYVDLNENGIRDAGEPEMPADSTEIVIRFRDGRVYQAFPVDSEGLAPFDNLFPFFHWLVAEVGFASLKATGLTYQVDAGGPVPADGVLNPQEQICVQANIDNGQACTLGESLGDSRTLTGEVLTMGMQVFQGQTLNMDFGKAPYSGEENGGISGIVFYATTRAEDDPRFAAGEEWEPGIPRVQVNLYQSDGDGNRVDQDGGGVTAPDIDHAPLGNFPGAEDVDGGTPGVFDYGDAVQVTWTDSWDDSLPAGCQGEAFVAFPGTPDEAVKDCFDGLRNFNQIREAVFDGGYAFASYQERDAGGVLTGAEIEGLPTNLYVVEAITPPGYLHVKEEDRNVDFGDEFVPQPNRGAINALLPDIEIGPNGITVDLSAPASCVGDTRPVPDLFSFLTFADGSPLPGVDSLSEDNAAPFAGDVRPLCDRKVVALTPGSNSAADFFMFTQVPKAAMVVGTILDDLSNEFDPNSPNFGEKYAPPWLPVVFRDWSGHEITRVYSDQYGKYNAILPSTYTISAPHPSGVSPSMITACMNDASPIPNPDYDPITNPNVPERIIDPFRDTRYSQFCYTLQYMPGATTYLDTPVLPVSAFAGKDEFPLDCEVPHGTPEILYVNSGSARGPFVNSSLAAAGPRTFVIKSAGRLEVLNPAFGAAGEPQTIMRDYRFGGASDTGTGRVFLIDQAGAETELSVGAWFHFTIRATVPRNLPAGRYQLVVEKGDLTRSKLGVTVTVSNGWIPRIRVPEDQPTIQAAIDAAANGTLITVKPGTYEEMVVMNKRVQLQGWGARSTVINANPVPFEKIQAWRDTVNAKYDAGEWDELPGQEREAGGFPEVPAFIRDEGAGITVLANDPFPDAGPVGPNVFRRGPAGLRARIDGFTITGGVNGGGILVNGYADDLEIYNNRIVSNQGTLAAGGIRLGDNFAIAEGDQPTDSQNHRIRIWNNHIAQNGGLAIAGGGISVFTGSDGYRIDNNFICGNFSQSNGGGIGHFGRSRGFITNNQILFNQVFAQDDTVGGGGIYVGGVGGVGVGVGDGAAGMFDNLSLSPGSGSVLIDGNLIQGNHAGAGDGGGILTQFVNGQDVAFSPNGTGPWHKINIFNNTIVNNVAAMSGGGISMLDTAWSRIYNNTIANNDSTATGELAFSTPNSSTPQPGAGIAMHEHINNPGTTLRDALENTGGSVNGTRFRQGISRPALISNIVWHNRQFSWNTVIAGDGTQCFELLPNVSPVTTDCGTPGGAAPVYDDIAVVGTASGNGLQPRNSLMSEGYTGPASGHPSNILTADAGFVDDHVNGGAGTSINLNEPVTGIELQPALDEGGNYIDVRYGPLTPTGDYHLDGASVAIDEGHPAIVSNPSLATDIDGDARPTPGTDPDIGSDETL